MAIGPRLRTLLLGVLGGAAAAVVVASVLLLGAVLAAAVGLNDEPATGWGVRFAAGVAACAAAGTLPGVLAPRVRTPGRAALLGAATVIGATAIFRILAPGAGTERATGPYETVAGIVFPGVVGLGAPLLWAPVRGSASLAFGRAVAAIGGRVGAFALALMFALMSAPMAVFALMGVIGGLRVPRLLPVLVGLGLAMVCAAFVGTSVLCLRLAGVPRRAVGSLPGFEPRLRSAEAGP